MYGIYVKSTRGIPYAIAIAKGYKTLETRTRDVFKSIFKDHDTERVAIIETMRSTPIIIGFCTLHRGQKVDRETFHTDEYFNKHLVPPGSKFDVGNREFKWCYECSDAELLDRPVFLPKDIINHGRSYCEFNFLGGNNGKS